MVYNQALYHPAQNKQSVNGPPNQTFRVNEPKKLRICPQYCFLLDYGIGAPVAWTRQSNITYRVIRCAQYLSWQVDGRMATRMHQV